MDINTKTQLTNSFSKGMNTDLSDAVLGNDQYRLANNLRFVTNVDENTGELHLIEGATHNLAQADNAQNFEVSGSIIASTEIRNYGVIITKGEDSWSVWRFDGTDHTEVVCIDNDDCDIESGRISLVTKYEDEDNIKVYIADGKHPVMVVNIMLSGITNYQKITSYPFFKPIPPTFVQLINGQIKGGNVQYSYQLYNVRGNFSEMSIPTRIIPLHNSDVALSNIKSFKGVEAEKESNKGVLITIPVDKNKMFDSIKIFRVTYVEAGQLPLIECICDRKVTNTEHNSGLTFDDIGQDALEVLTIEEYNSMSGIHIIPKTIESKDDRMFAANIKTILTKFDEKLNLLAKKFVANQHIGDQHEFFGDEAYNGNSIFFDLSNKSLLFDLVEGACEARSCNMGSQLYPLHIVSWEFVTPNGDLYGDENGFKGEIKLSNRTYANPKNVYDYTSLRRNELYRYGIIFYNTKGESSSVFWIGDIRTPYSWELGYVPFELEDVPQEELSLGEYVGERNRLKINPLGIKFTINVEPINHYFRENDIDYEINGAEIVRAQRTIKDIATISQGVLSRPGRRTVQIPTINENDELYDGMFKDFPLSPSGFLTTSDIIYNRGKKYNGDDEENEDLFTNTSTYEDLYRFSNCLTTGQNASIYLFVCPEVCYQQESFKDLLDKTGYRLEPILYLYDNYYKSFTSGQNKIAYGNGSLKLPNGHDGRYFLNYNSADTNDLFPEKYFYIKLYKGVDNININKGGAFYLLNKDSIEIKNSNIAPALRWDDLAESGTASASSWPLKYVDKLINIGDNAYVNFVAGNLYDVPVEDNGSGREFLYQSGSRLNTKMGAGGKCALLKLDIEKPQFGMPSDQMLCCTCFDPNDNHDISAAGTFLCNIRQNVIPYGGRDETSLKSTTYISMGYFLDFELLNSVVMDVYGGDTFIQPLEYVSMHKCFHNKISPYIWGKKRTLCIVYAIPVETNINIAYSYGFEFSKNSKPVNIQDLPGDVYGLFTQDTPLYKYNGTYSSSSRAKLYAAYQDDPSNIKNEDYRCYHSQPKDNNEKQDGWLLYRPADFLDVDTRMGPITGLRRFHNNLVFWLEMATGLFSVNERTTITDDSNLPLMLGSGGILARYDYINTSNGMHEGEFADAQSDSTLYWWDHNKWELCAYAGGQESVVLSKVKGVQNFLNKQRDSGSNNTRPLLAFDKKYNELIACVTNGSGHEEGSLVYSEQIQAFSSLYSIKPAHKMSFADSIYFATDDTYVWNNATTNYNFFKWNEKSYGNVSNSIHYTEGIRKPLKPYLKYIVNDNTPFVKVYDTCVFGGRFYKGTGTYRDNLKFTFKTPLKQKAKLDGSDKTITDREYDFRFAVPRAGKVVNDQWVTEPYGDRMRGKTMQCELESTSNDLDFSLQYITTKYRISWS